MTDYLLLSVLLVVLAIYLFHEQLLTEAQQRFDRAMKWFDVSLICFMCAIAVFAAVVIWRMKHW